MVYLAMFTQVQWSFCVALNQLMNRSITTQSEQQTGESALKLEKTIKSAGEEASAKVGQIIFQLLLSFHSPMFSIQSYSHHDTFMHPHSIGRCTPPHH